MRNDMARKKKQNNEMAVQVLRPEDIIAKRPFSQSLVNETKEDLNVFLVAQARLELERVMSLTKTLDKMQAMYQEKALEYMADNDDQSALEYLPIMIENLSKCLDRSYALINNVVNNEKIMNFSIVQNNITDSNIQINEANNPTDLADPKSRERVRKAVAEILSNLPATGEGEQAP